MDDKSEAKIQAEIFMHMINENPELKGLLFHVPNGGLRTKVESSRFKAIGTTAGIPDLMCILPSLKYNGFACEVKKPGGRMSKEQKKMLDKWQLIANYYVCTVTSLEEFLYHWNKYFD